MKRSTIAVTVAGLVLTGAALTAVVVLIVALAHSPPVAPRTPRDVSELRTGLLAIEDLPAGWQVQNVPAIPPNATDAAQTACGAPATQAAAPIANIGEAFFSSGLATGQRGSASGSQGIGLYAHGEAQRVFDATVSALRGCKSGGRTDPDGTIVTWITQPLSIPRFGDESSAFYTTGTSRSTDPPSVTAIVVERRGDYLSLLFIAFLQASLDKPTVLALGEKADVRLQSLSR